MTTITFDDAILMAKTGFINDIPAEILLPHYLTLITMKAHYDTEANAILKEIDAAEGNIRSTQRSLRDIENNPTRYSHPRQTNHKSRLLDALQNHEQALADAKLKWRAFINLHHMPKTPAFVFAAPEKKLYLYLKEPY